MSKIEKSKASGSLVLIKINGPIVKRIVRWFDDIRDRDPIQVDSNSYIIKKLEGAPMFDDYHDFPLFKKEVQIIYDWSEEEASFHDQLDQEIVSILEEALK